MSVHGSSALIGYTGFVGGNLHRQHPFDNLYNSKNFQDIRDRNYELLVCAGISAVKWQANKDPGTDKKNIQKLQDVLATVKADTFVLISTIDVYPVLVDVDENFNVHAVENHAYGTHRREFEDFCQQHFNKCHIIRLPGLFGQGLKKNVIYDLLNDNCLDMININSSFQYYYLEKLWEDVQIIMEHDLSLVNLFTEPVTTREIVDTFFPAKQLGENAVPEAHYNLQTCHAQVWGKQGKYIYTHDEMLQQIKQFIRGYGKA